jgi:hypothetical protein
MPVSRFWPKDWVRSYPFLNVDLQGECLSTLTGIMNACQLLWRKLQEGFKQVHVGVFSGTCFTLTNARISRMELKQFQWFGASNDPILVQCPIILGSEVLLVTIVIHGVFKPSYFSMVVVRLCCSRIHWSHQSTLLM